MIPTIAAGDFATVNATITPSGEAIAGDYQITFRASSDDANASMEVRTHRQPFGVRWHGRDRLDPADPGRSGLGLPSLRPEIGHGAPQPF